jgi:Cd2+/Zn2+-exporting ATPase
MIMEDKNLKLEGLDCENCAGKIKSALAQNCAEDLQEISIQVATQDMRLVMACKHEKPCTKEEILAKVRAVIGKVEPDIQVIDPEKQETAQEKSYTWDYCRFTLTAILLVLALFSQHYWQIGFALLGYAFIGYDIVWKALRNLGMRNFLDENFLLLVASIGAFILGEYSEGLAVLLFYQIGEHFQSLALQKSRKSIEKMLGLQPEYAHILVNQEIQRLHPSLVKIGDILLVKAGEKIALDGKITTGKSALNTAALTGESLPRYVEVGAEVLSGSINLSGVLEIEVTHAFSDSTLSRVLELVQNATHKKAPTERFITKFAKIYTPSVVFLALLFAILPPLLGFGDWSLWVHRALVFLVISCPCALVISIPLGFFGGIAAAAKHGILVKGGHVLENLRNIKTMAFDKTGTLTTGNFVLDEIYAKIGTGNGLLALAASLEQVSSHPIATAIVSASKDKFPAENIQEMAGMGLMGEVLGKKIALGKAKLMHHLNIQNFQEENLVGSVVYMAINGDYAGYFLVRDQIKAETKQTLKDLKNLGVEHIAMLTGDQASIAHFVGKELGINQIYAGLMPQDKVQVLEELTATGEKVLFAGDGINDAPVLMRADVGVAMGGVGSDMAIEAADMVLTDANLARLPKAIEIARKTHSIVWQNISLTFGVKLITLLLGAGGIATLWEAIFADVGVALLAILNAWRIIKE